MEVLENSFADACYTMNTIDELREALTEEPDRIDMETWGLSESEWRQQIEAAIDLMSQEEEE